MAEYNRPMTTIVPHNDPDGNNNWYKNNISLSFNYEDESDLYKIFYKWDNNSTWKELEIDQDSETLAVVAKGGETIGQLEKYPIIAQSITLKKNAATLVQNTHYNLNIETGTVGFLTPISANDVVKADYDYSIIVETEIVIQNAVGGETQATLDNTHVLEVTLKKNGRNFTDFIYDSYGTIIFNSPLSSNDQITADYKYVYLGSSSSISGEILISSAIGGETSLTLDQAPVAINSESIYLNGVSLNKGSDYSINYNTGVITLSSELSSGDQITANYYGNIVNETVISSGISGQTNGLLKNIPIIDDTFTILKNSTPLRRYSHYAVSDDGQSLITLSQEAFPSGLTIGDKLEAQYQFEVINEQTVTNATSGQTNFYLFESPIITGTLRIYLNGELLNESTDYTVNYTNGYVTLIGAYVGGLTSGDRITSDYHAQSQVYETVVSSATGGEKYFLLDHRNVIADTLVLIYNVGTTLDQNPEYTLDLDTGQLILETALSGGEAITASYHYLIENESVVLALGGEVSATLTKTIILSNTIYKNAIALTENVDYTINIITGEVSLTSPLQSGDSLTADYDYSKSVLGEILLKNAFTTNQSLIGGSTLKIYKNAVLLSLGSDYTVDLINGLISFNIPFLSTDSVTTSYFYGKQSVSPTVEIFNGPGSNYSFTNDQIVLGVTVVKNPGTITLTEFEDYFVNYDAGSIELVVPLVGGENITVTYNTGAPLCIPGVGIRPIEFYSEDVNGNKEAVKTNEFKFDPISPNTSADIPLGLRTEDTVINFFSSDSISGVERTYFTIDGSDPDLTSSTGNKITLDSTGNYIIKYFSVDLAGNQENIKSGEVSIEIDKEAPEISIQESFPFNGDNGYYRTSPEITLEASGELSIDKIYYKLATTDNPTTAKYTSSVDLSSGIDLSSVFNIKLELDQNGEELLIDVKGADPANTSIVEIINAINNATRRITAISQEDSITDGAFVLTTLNSNIVSVSRIYNLTTGENYIYLSHTSDTITFTGNIAPLSTDQMAVSYEYSSPDIAEETDSSGNAGSGYITLTSPSSILGIANAEIKFLQPASADATNEVFGLDENSYPHTFTELNVFLEYTGTPISLPFDGNFTLSTYGIDLAGNEGNIVSKSYQLDSESPISIVNIIGGTVGNNGYYITNPTIRFSATDNLSGVARIFYKWDSTTPPFIEYFDTRPIDDSTEIPSEGEHTLYYYSIDRAGNQEIIQNELFKLDETDPVTIDNSSFINTVPINLNQLKISKTGPGSILNISNGIMEFTGPEPAGPWNLKYFTLGDIRDAINSFSGTGYNAIIETDFVSLSEAENQPASLLFEINDISISGVPASPTRIYSSVGIKLSATDTHSGVEQTYYEITDDGSSPSIPTVSSSQGLSAVAGEQLALQVAGSWVFNTTAIGGETEAKVENNQLLEGSLVLTKNGIFTLTEGVDYLINYSTGKILLFIPLILGDYLNADYVHGTLITVEEDATYKVKYFSIDNASNEETVKDLDVSQITLVRNLPTIDFIPDIAPTVSGWFDSNPNITIQANPTVPATISELHYRWNTDPWTVVYGSSVVVTIPADGIHTLEAYATDSLNRVSKINLESFKKDEVAPTATDNTKILISGEIVISAAVGGETEADLDNPYIKVGTLVVYKNAVPLTEGVDFTVNYLSGHLIFIPTLILVGDTITADYETTITSSSDINVIINVTDPTPGSGVYRTYYEIGTVSSPPSNPNTVTSSYVTGSTVVIALTVTEQYIIKYMCQDVAGNINLIYTTETVILDKEEPITTLVITPPSPDGENNFYKTPALINFSVNAFSSGLKNIFYRLDSLSSFTEFTVPFILTDGIFDVEYYSVDLAGNIEPVKTTNVKQDSTVPVTTDSIPTVAVSNETIELSVSDNVSGIYKTFYQILDLGLVPINSVSVVNEVVAVLSSPVTSLTLSHAFVEPFSETIYQNGVPLTVGLHFNMDYDYGIINFTFPISTGTISADYNFSADLNNQNQGSVFDVTAEGNYIVKYFSIDNAGNYEAVKTAANVLNLDLTEPVISNILPTDLIIDQTTEEITFNVLDSGINPSGIDPFSIRIFVDGIEYSMLRNSQYFIVEAVGIYAPDIINDISTLVSSEVKIPSAAGGEQNFTLNNIPVALGTQRVYKNAELLTENIDYSFNNTLGTISLVNPLELGDNLYADYRYITLFHNEYDITLASTTNQSESFSGGSTLYTLANIPIASNSFIVLDNGVYQVEGTDFTLNKITGQITFTFPTTGPVVVTYKNINGPLKSEIPNFDVIESIIIDPSDVAGNTTDPLIYDFRPIDTEPPFISELNPKPNVKDVSLYTNVMFQIFDNQSGVDVQSIKVKINNDEFSIKTLDTILLQYTGSGAIVTLTINNSYFITRVNGSIDVSFSFLDLQFEKIQDIIDYLNLLPTYSATLLNSTLSQEPSISLLNVRDLNIKTSATLYSKLVFDTSFVYNERANGYLITITPETIFYSEQNVSVQIEASDKAGNEMTPVSYSFQTQLGASLSIDRRLEIQDCSDIIHDRINANLPSNYNRKQYITEFHQFTKILSDELAKLKIRSNESLDDYYFSEIRNLLLWQNLGYLINFLPSDEVSHDKYKSFLISISQGYHQGSLKKSIEDALSLFTDGNIYVRERFIGSSDISEQFVFDVLIEITSTSESKNIIELLNNDLYKIVRQIKPAHTFFLLGFLFSENFGLASGCNFIPLFDIFGVPIIDAYGNQLSEYDGSAYKVFKNGFLLTEIKDYILSTSLGIISLTEPLNPGDRLSADYKEKHYVEKELKTTVVGTTEFDTSFYPILPLSVTIYKNENPLKERIDYEIDLTTGHFILTDPLINIDVLEISYSWYVQIFDETLIDPAIGGEISATLSYFPIATLRFAKGEKVSEFAICDRQFIDFAFEIPFIDFHLNGKPQFFTFNDPLSIFNDLAQFVDTSWQAIDYGPQNYIFDYTNSLDYFPLFNDSENFYILDKQSDSYNTQFDTIIEGSFYYLSLLGDSFPSMTDEDFAWYSSIGLNDSFSNPIDNLSIEYLLSLSDLYDIPTEENIWNLIGVYTDQFSDILDNNILLLKINHQELFLNPLDEVSLFDILNLSETYNIQTNVNDQLSSEFEFSYSDIYEEPVDEINNINYINQEIDNIQTYDIVDKIESIVFRFGESFPVPSESSLEYQFAYYDEAGEPFYLPDTINHNKESYLANSRLNTNNRLWSPKYIDSLISVTLI